eukprot:RCo003716
MVRGKGWKPQLTDFRMLSRIRNQLAQLCEEVCPPGLRSTEASPPLLHYCRRALPYRKQFTQRTQGGLVERLAPVTQTGHGLQRGSAISHDTPHLLLLLLLLQLLGASSYTCTYSAAVQPPSDVEIRTGGDVHRNPRKLFRWSRVPAPLRQLSQRLPLPLTEPRVPLLHHPIRVLLGAVPHLGKAPPKGFQPSLFKSGCTLICPGDLLEVALRELVPVAPYTPQVEDTVGILKHTAPADKRGTNSVLRWNWGVNLGKIQLSQQRVTPYGDPLPGKAQQREQLSKSQLRRAEAPGPALHNGKKGSRGVPGGKAGQALPKSEKPELIEALRSQTVCALQGNGGASQAEKPRFRAGGKANRDGCSDAEFQTGGDVHRNPRKLFRWSRVPAPLRQLSQRLPLPLTEPRVPLLHHPIRVLLGAVPHLGKASPKGFQPSLSERRRASVRSSDLLEVALRELVPVAPYAPQVEDTVGILKHAAPSNEGGADIGSKGLRWI